MSQTGNVLVIGAGIAGMKASLMLAGASNKVYLVEKLPIIGGKVIKNEESFPNLECSTCMVAPIQQDVLQNPNIETLTYSVVEKIEGIAGDFSVVIRRRARYVSLTDCNVSNGINVALRKGTNNTHGLPSGALSRSWFWMPRHNQAVFLPHVCMSGKWAGDQGRTRFAGPRRPASRYTDGRQPHRIVRVSNGLALILPPTIVVFFKGLYS